MKHHWVPCHAVGEQVQTLNLFFYCSGRKSAILQTYIASKCEELNMTIYCNGVYACIYSGSKSM